MIIPESKCISLQDKKFKYYTWLASYPYANLSWVLLLSAYDTWAEIISSVFELYDELWGGYVWRVT